MKLDLGVWDIAYSDPTVQGATTTGQVAKILEEKYSVMGEFYDHYKQDVEDLLIDALVGELEARLQGKPPTAIEVMPLQKVDTLFKQYLSRNEWQQLTGQTIKSAQLAISHRKKGKKRAGPRPAFIDTGLYQKAFTAWLTR